MSIVLESPLSGPAMALVCCTATLLASPFVGLATKFLFLSSALTFGNISSSLLARELCFVGSLVVVNLVLAGEEKVQLLPTEEWTFAFLTTNICAIGIFMICKELSTNKLQRFLCTYSDIWKDFNGVCLLDIDGNIMGADGHKNFSKFYTPLEVQEQRPQSDLSTAIQKGELIKTEFSTDPEGEQRLVQTCIKPLRSHGIVVGFFRVSTQVYLPLTAVSDLFTSVNGSESTYKELFGQAMDHSLLMLDPQGNILSWNPGVEKIKGYSREDVLGQHMSMFYTPEDQIVGRPYADLLIAQTDGRNEMEGWMVRKDGSLFWACTVLSAVRDNTGKLLGFSEVTRDLTDKKRDISKMRATEEKYQLLISSVQDYTIIMLDRFGVITTWNAGAQKNNGYRANEVIGRHFSIFYDTDDLASGKPERELEQAAQEGRFEEEGWLVRKDGTRFWASVVLSSIYNSKREVVGFSKVTRDITDKKLTQAALRESEERFQLLVASVKDYAIVMLDINGCFTTWNSGVQNTAGYTADELIGRHFSLFYLQEELQVNKPETDLEIALREGRFEAEGWKVRKDRTMFWANVILASVYDERGILVGYSSITRDMTEKKHTQEQLKLVEERFQLLISSVKDYAIFMLDTNGYIVSWNTGAQRIKGYSASEVIGKHFSIVYSKQDRANSKPQKALSIAAREGRYEDEGLRVRKDGTTFWANVIITAMRDPDGNLVGFSKVTRDVTERKQVEAKLVQAKVAAESASLAKQSFLAMMSHEIRTPLHAVITLSQLLQDTPLSIMQRDYLDTIHSSSKQLLCIINDILDFSKIESGKLDLNLKSFNLRQCVEETLDLVLIKPGGKPASNLIDVVYIFDEGVPEHIIGDNVRVRQILVNYLSNAIKFTERGEIVVRVSFRQGECAKNSAKLTFSIRDTGIGIKSPNIDGLFQPFHQIGAVTSRVYGGTGLGLAISKKLSQLMGGDVWVESEEGTGSTFYFNIMAQYDPCTPPPPPPCNMSVLVMDDSTSGCEALAAMLHRAGAHAQCTQDVYEAKDWLRCTSFRAMFVTRTITSRNVLEMDEFRRLAIPMFLTGTPDTAGYHSTALPEDVLHADCFSSFIPKPFRIDMITAVVTMLRKDPAHDGVFIAQPSTGQDTPKTPSSPIILGNSALRILVAEDNVVNRKVAWRILEKLGYSQIDLVENGLEVLTAVEKKVYDVILMDIQMPYMDGWTATEEIFKKYPPNKRPYIIAMTAYAYEHDQQRCALVGMRAHVAKPVDMAVLAEILRSCPSRTDDL